MPDSPDNPFGVTGQALGLQVREPPFEEGEEVRWEARANRFQHGVRAIGGRIYLTDRRLVFAPNKFEEKVAGRAWSAQLADLDTTFVKGADKDRSRRGERRREAAIRDLAAGGGGGDDRCRYSGREGEYLKRGSFRGRLRSPSDVRRRCPAP
ncbi:MAG TPA: hypothetical protein VH275_06505 [Solirubrobacterales bacterium]|jgi:hypothetical protein|nr:hypothetical protein [Solirubrobacterales bacterium]